MKHSTAQHSTAQHSTATAKLKSFFPLFSLSRSCRFSRSFFWIVPSLFLLLFCNHLFAFQVVSVSPSSGSGDQDQTFRISFDQPAQNINLNVIPTAAFQALIEFYDGDSGNIIPNSEFSHPYKWGSGGYFVFEVTPINGSVDPANNNDYASECGRSRCRPI